MEKECCKRLIPAEWDQKEIAWRDKPFFKSHYRAFLHVPINIGKKITRGMAKVQDSGLGSENMVLVKNDTLWGADILIPISKNTDQFEKELVTGRFFTRLFEGHYSDMRHWIKEMKEYCLSKGKKAQEYIFWYATCPKCSKKRGDKAQVVVFAKVE